MSKSYNETVIVVSKNETLFFALFIALIVCAFVAFFIFADLGPKKKIYTSSEIKEFEILVIDRPKHFYVTVLDTSNHVLFERVGRSKHCNSWSGVGRPKVHGIIKVNTHRYYYEKDTAKKEYYEIDDRQLNNLFCR